MQVHYRYTTYTGVKIPSLYCCSVRVTFTTKSGVRFLSQISPQTIVSLPINMSTSVTQHPINILHTRVLRSATFKYKTRLITEHHFCPVLQSELRMMALTKSSVLKLICKFHPFVRCTDTSSSKSTSF